MLNLPLRALSAIVALWLVSLIPIEAADLSVSIEPPQGWSIQQNATQTGYPQINFVTPKGRDACLFVMEIGEVGPTADQSESLKNIHSWWFQQLRNKIIEPDNLVKFTSEHGEFLVSIFEDPNLIGKPIIPEDYKFTIHITGIVDGRYVMKCDLLTQEKDGKDLEEVKAAISKMKSK